MLSKKNLIVLILFTLLLLGACGKEETITTEKEFIPTSNSFESEPQSSFLDYLTVRNVSYNESVSIYYVTGEISNRSSQSFSEVISMAIYDSNDNVVRVRPYRLNIGPNETIAFEEMVGITDEVTGPPYKVRLQER